MPSFFSKVFKRMSSQKPDSKTAAAPATAGDKPTDGDEPTSGNEPTFSIQPHPATTNDPADLQPDQTGGLASNPNEQVFHARDPHVPSKEIKDGLPKPLGRDELHARQEELNK